MWIIYSYTILSTMKVWKVCRISELWLQYVTFSFFQEAGSTPRNKWFWKWHHYFAYFKFKIIPELPTHEWVVCSFVDFFHGENGYSTTIRQDSLKFPFPLRLFQTFRTLPLEKRVFRVECWHVSIFIILKSRSVALDPLRFDLISNPPLKFKKILYNNFLGIRDGNFSRTRPKLKFQPI